MIMICETVNWFDLIWSIARALIIAAGIAAIVRYNYGYNVASTVSESIAKAAKWYLLIGWAVILAFFRILRLVYFSNAEATITCATYIVFTSIIGVLVTTWVGKRLFGLFHLAGFGVAVGLLAGDDVGLLVGSQIIKWLG